MARTVLAARASAATLDARCSLPAYPDEFPERAMDPNAFSTPDWVGISLGVVGILVSGVGLSIAFVQLRRIRTSATAVAKAVENQREELSGGFLLVRAGDLERIEADLRAAFSFEEPTARQLATHAALNWRRTGTDLQTLAKSRAQQSEELIRAMSDSLAVVAVALNDLSDHEISVPAACRSLLAKMNDACERARETGGAIILPEP